LKNVTEQRIEKKNASGNGKEYKGETKKGEG